MITMIPRSKLEPHPDNPRKDLGDLSELSASIAKQGLLQNLTVVPSPVDPSKYRIVIGHRRFAASGKVGLDELPCSIDEKMTYPEQIAVMMSENIQRNDLTVTERVGGIQMMMNLGMDVAEISGNTGISDTTVRRYAKLAKLDRSDMRQAEHRGATLLQFSEIIEIEDEAMRCEALEKVGTNDYQNVMSRVRLAKRRAEQKPILIEKLSSFATEIKKEDYNRYARCCSFWYSSSNAVSDADKFTPKKNTRYVYLVKDTDVTLYEVRPPVDDAKEQAKREAAERMKNRANHERGISGRFKEMRDAYMATLSLKGREEAAKRFVLWVLTRSSYLSNAMRGGSFDQTFLADRAEQPESYTGSIVVSADEISVFPEKKLLLGMVLVAYDRISQGDMTLIDRYSGRPKDVSSTSDIRGLYLHMEALGYPISTEEHEWLDGTHECFTYTGEAERNGE